MLAVLKRRSLTSSPRPFFTKLTSYLGSTPVPGQPAAGVCAPCASRPASAHSVLTCHGAEGVSAGLQLAGLRSHAQFAGRQQRCQGPSACPLPSLPAQAAICALDCADSAPWRRLHAAVRAGQAAMLRDPNPSPGPHSTLQRNLGQKVSSQSGATPFLTPPTTNSPARASANSCRVSGKCPDWPADPETWQQFTDALAGLCVVGGVRNDVAPDQLGALCSRCRYIRSCKSHKSIGDPCA